MSSSSSTEIENESMNDKQTIILAGALSIFLLIFLYVIWINQGRKGGKKRGGKKRGGKKRGGKRK